MMEEVRDDDDAWLYEGGGDTPNGPSTASAPDVAHDEGEKGLEKSSQETETSAEDGLVEETNINEESEEDDEDSDDDDGVQVVIGDIKASSAGPAQTPFGGTGVVAGVKRSAPAADKKGKFAVEDFDSPGTINGVSALEFNIDGVEEKPWRKPGADVTDYFNYGFTEETWRAYIERQKRMRFESGGPQIINPGGQKLPDNRGVITVAFGPSGPGPNLRMDMMRRREEPKENTIQVMTADRREYSRKNFEMGMGGPPIPPSFNPTIPPPNFPPPGHGPPPEFMNMNPDFYGHGHLPPHQFYSEDRPGYEEQWMDHHTETWDMGMAGPVHGGGSSTIVSLTTVPNVPPPPGDEDTKNDRKGQ